MANIAVQRIGGDAAPVSSIFNEMNALAERTRQRAFEIFENGGTGDPMRDWLTAERDLFQIPKSDLVEKDGKFEVSMEAPGYDPEDVQVTALPNALIVRAKCSHEHRNTEGTVHFCEYAEKSLFRRIDLPQEINVDKVTASLDKGVLHLMAAKESGSGSQAKSQPVSKSHQAS